MHKWEILAFQICYHPLCSRWSETHFWWLCPGLVAACQISRQHSTACDVLLNLLLDVKTPRASVASRKTLFFQAVSSHGLGPPGNRQPVSLVLFQDTQMSSYLRVHIHAHIHISCKLKRETFPSPHHDGNFIHYKQILDNEGRLDYLP